MPEAIDSYTVSWGGSSYGKGQTITETLNKYGTWQIKTYGDLSGAHVTSTKPVAVISGNKKTNIGTGRSSDHLTEMMIPVPQWGKEFLTIPIPDRTVGDYFRYM